MHEQLGLIVFERLHDSLEVRALTAEYVRGGALPVGSFNDCLHIAYAVVHGCDFVLSWNFDQTRPKTKGKVKEVNAAGQYGGIGIMQPDDFLRGDYR